MAGRVYATKEQYLALAEATFDGDTESLLPKRLRSASVQVDYLTRFARYDVDVNGVPVEPHLLEVFAEATVAIVEHWGETGDPSGADAAEGAVKIGSVSIGTTSSSRDTETERDRLIRRYGEKSLALLETEGLLAIAVSHS